MSAILKQKLIDIANGFTKYGLWKGGGSGALSEMTDVTLTNLQANDILKYNGSVWVNDDNLQKQIDTLNSNFENKSSFKNLSNTYIGNIDGKNLYYMFGTVTLDSSGFISVQLNELKPIFCLYDVSAMVIKNNAWFSIGSNGKLVIVNNISLNIDATDLDVGSCNCCIKIVYSSIN